ncbi:YeiH family protein [Bacillus cihuensis]|uniref:YeiH family protein n=1 Tax=Bacillus cihuensis TaxID=1208599 RepID=UPI0003FEEB44|nr:putative sulfate exporter family transporter [Bacillus cihuensis]
MSKVKEVIPGLVLCIVIACFSILVANKFTLFGAGTFAIIAGIIVGNIGTGKIKRFNAGTKYSESKLLYYAIILLGGTISFHSIVEIGLSGVIFILLQMAVTLFAALWIGKKLALPENFRLLMASGNAVCGSSAIAATAPAIQAEEKEKSLAITVVNLTGTVLMFILPLITTLLYKNEMQPSSAMIGGVLQSVGQVVASGSMVSEVVKEEAAVYKMVRILLLSVVIYGLMRYSKKAPVGKSKKIKLPIPWYISGFLLLCALHSIFAFPILLQGIIQNTGSFLEVIALAGIGLRVQLRDLVEQGGKVAIYTGLLTIVQILAAALLIAWLIL